jgi:hypothetical protein
MTESEMTLLLLKLADAGVTGVKVSYSGGGDSGAIDAISYTAEPCETPEDVEDICDDAYTSGSNLSDIDSDAYKAIEDFAYQRLDDVEDWWNNDGGFGTLCICIPSGKYIINNHINITNTEDYFHDGDLLSGCKG